MSARSTSPFERAVKKILANLGGAMGAKEGAGEALAGEVARLEEAAEKFFRKVDERLEALRSLEERLDAKARALEELAARAERAAALPAGAVEAQRRAVAALHGKGLSAGEIASLLDIPRGEVELMLDLERSRRPAAG